MSKRCIVICLFRYKTKYQANDSSSEDYFSHILALPLVNSFLGMFYGFLKYEIAMKGVHHEQENPVPVSTYFKLGIIEVSIMLLGNWAITLSSFTTYNLIHCCSFLSVVIFAVFFSRVRDEGMRIGKSKIYISLLVCFGIILYNSYSSHSEENSINKPLTWFSFSVIFVLLMI